MRRHSQRGFQTDLAARLAATLWILALIVASFANASEAALRKPSGRLEASAFPVSTPEDQGMDSHVLADMVEGFFDTRQDDRPHRVIIIRHGHSVLDITFYPFALGFRHDIASAGKIIHGALIGIAIDQGFIGSVDDPVLSYFPDREIANRDANKEAITIAHLLAQRSGIDFGPNISAMKTSPDWVQWILDRPMVAEPGGAYDYSDINGHLATAVLAQATGRTPLQFAQQHLFGPLRISDLVWAADPQGVNFGGGDQQLLPIDFAKLGALYLSGGQWRGTQVLPAEWVELSMTTSPGPPVPHYPPEMTTCFHWIINSRLGVVDAAGAGGQFIRLVPDDDLVLVVVAGGACGQEEALVNRLSTYASQAILSSSPLAANPQGVARLASLGAAARLADDGPPQPVPPLPALAHTISGQRFVMETNPVGLEWISLSFTGGSEALLEYKEAETEPVAVLVGLDNVFRLSPGEFGLPFAAKGWWVDDSRFALLLDKAPLYTYYDGEFRFENGDVTLSVLDTPCGRGDPVTITGHLD